MAARIITIPGSQVDVDSTMAANSDGRVPSQKAVKTALGDLATDLAAGQIAPVKLLVEGVSGDYQLDATTATDVTLILTGDTAILPPINGENGQMVTYEIVNASPGDHAITFGGDGPGESFGWSATIPGFYPVTDADSICYLRVRFSDVAGGWHVLAIGDDFGLF